jgi:hypothetical protein
VATIVDNRMRSGWRAVVRRRGGYGPWAMGVVRIEDGWEGCMVPSDGGQWDPTENQLSFRTMIMGV